MLKPGLREGELKRSTSTATGMDYSPWFSPQDTIITMDYPTMVPVKDKMGIDAIEEYIDKIAAEQVFLSRFPPGYVEGLLKAYTPDYRDHFFNLSEIVFAMTE